MNLSLKPLIFFAFVVALCGAIFMPSRATAASPGSPPRSGTLQVQVIIPPSWQPMFEDRVADAFVQHLSDVFRQQGYHGDIVQLGATDQPASGATLLTVNLVEWRMDHIGNIECTFAANLQTGSAIRQLGVFNGMAFRWMAMPGRFGLSDTFGEAADDALRELYRSVAKTELVPGLRAS